MSKFQHGKHLHKKLYNEKYSGVPNITTGVQRVLDKKEKYGLIFGDVPMVAVLSDQDLCEVEFVDAGYPRGQFVFVMQKDYPYKELFDY